jgi:2-dehydro-3-deoxyphosphogluconate aldolase/(4S)-4-hydroxy-2-oxoglutarate aldolase
MEQRVFPVLRARDVEDAVTTARAAARAGMRIVELTATTPDVHEAVGPLTADGLVIGVGTIAESTMIERMAAAGARFVVSFFLPQGFVAAAHAAGLEAIPGGFTPAELAAARSAGADAVKLFPARLATPAYLSDLAPLLTGLRLVVTGGLEATTASLGPWLAAGVAGVGLGGLGTAAAVGANEVERRCRAALEAAAVAG